MGKKKLYRFAELKNFPNVFQPGYKEIFSKEFYLKGKWRSGFFNNTNPVILELACGKGEYTTGLAELYPDKNFIGIDIKGARIFVGAKYALDNQMQNVAFLRFPIDWLPQFFLQDEVDEIWITFPDPHLQASRSLKRLTSSKFLSIYTNVLKENGIIHLKTDNQILYDYTIDIVKTNKMPVLRAITDLNDQPEQDPEFKIHTFYEKKFLKTGAKINYLEFGLPRITKFNEPEIKYGMTGMPRKSMPD